MITVSNDSVIKVLNLKVNHERTIQGKGELSFATISPDSRRMAIVVDDKDVKILKLI